MAKIIMYMCTVRFVHLTYHTSVLYAEGGPKSNIFWGKWRSRWILGFLPKSGHPFITDFTNDWHISVYTGADSTGRDHNK